MGEIAVEVDAAKVAIVEIRRGPNNYFSYAMLCELADAFEDLQQGDRARAIVLCSEGKHFCAGADFGGEGDNASPHGGIYQEAVRLFSNELPVVAAVQGAAIGGGLGLALMPDIRVCAPEARFAANFARLGFHQGFGLSHTLPALVGQQAATDMLLSGRRVKGEEAVEMGLAYKLASLDELREVAYGQALEFAKSAPLAVRSIRKTLRGDLPAAIRAATDRELTEQTRLKDSNDWIEGVRSVAERRDANFTMS